MFDLLIAFRNLTRNRVRSALSLCAIVFGVVAIIISGGFIEWIFLDMRETTILSRLGHLQITRPGFLTGGSADPFTYLITHSENELKIIAGQPQVRLITPRLSFSGLISRGEATISFLAEGVEPEKEIFVSQQVNISQGHNLSSQDPKGLIIGEGLAANLDLKLGDKVVLLGTTESGGINAIECHVRGLFYTTSKAFDDTFLRLPIVTASELLRVSGSHTWVVLLGKTEDTDTVVDMTRKQFSQKKIKLEVTPWSTQANFYHSTVKLFSRQFSVVQFIIAVIIVLSISNLMTMKLFYTIFRHGSKIA